MKLNLGYIPADRVTDPDLLRDMAEQLPPVMRSICAKLDYQAEPNSPAFLASLDEALPDALRRRLRRADLMAMGVADRTRRYRILPDGRDREGYWWYYATIVRYLQAKGAVT